MDRGGLIITVSFFGAHRGPAAWRSGKIESARRGVT